MKLKVKMIGVDLDGTLLTTDKRLLPHTAEVLSQAASQGIVVLPITGRPCAGCRKSCWLFRVSVM